MRIQLERIEADVVVVLVNSGCGRTRILPHWECEMSGDDLMQYAIRESLTFTEECGGGYCDAEVFDFRVVAAG